MKKVILIILFFIVFSQSAFAKDYILPKNSMVWKSVIHLMHNLDLLNINKKDEDNVFENYFNSLVEKNLPIKRMRI